MLSKTAADQRQIYSNFDNKTMVRLMNETLKQANLTEQQTQSKDIILSDKELNSGEGKSPGNFNV